VLALGNILNGSSFRGGARGFQLEGLLKVINLSLGLFALSFEDYQLKETKTARAEQSGCPTLLHYLARVLMRTDPSLCTFVDEIPHLEPAARGEHRSAAILKALIDHTSLKSLCKQSFSPSAL
jgi:hypothetical protein